MSRICQIFDMVGNLAVICAMINVLLCSDKLELVAAFYAALGIELVPEKHGNGPDHFFFKSEIACELYPPRTPPEAAFVLRIDTKDIDVSLQNLKTQFNEADLIIGDVQTLKSSKKVILRDPDGRVVELIQNLDI